MTELLTTEPAEVTAAEPSPELTAAAADADAAFARLADSDLTPEQDQPAKTPAGDAEEVTPKDSDSKPDDDSAKDAEPSKETPAADATPVEATDRMLRGNKYAGLTAEQLKSLSPAQAQMLDDFGATYDRGMGKAGADIQRARKAAKDAAADTTPPENAGDGAVGTPGSTDAEDGKDDLTFDTKDFTDADGYWDDQKAVEKFGQIATTVQGERQQRLVLQATVDQLTDTVETLVTDAFFKGLDPKTYGPIDKKATIALAKDVALGVAMGEGKPIGIIEAIERVLGITDPETIRKLEREALTAKGRKAQAGAIHEPGRGAGTKRTALEIAGEQADAAWAKMA